MKLMRSRLLLAAEIVLAVQGFSLARNVSVPLMKTSAFADSVTLTDAGCEMTP